MRVLHILNELRPSGAETMLRSAAGFWRAQGICGEILTTGENAGDYAMPLREAGYRLHHFPFRPSFAYFARVYRWLLANRYDSIHIHCERANFWFALLAFLSGHFRIVRSVHGLFAFRGVLRWRRFAQRYLLRALLKVKTVAVSPAVQRVERDTYRNPSLQVPNWFDSESFRPPTLAERSAARRHFGLAEGVFSIATVGNCSTVKNHSAVLEALALLSRSRNIVYLHAGCEETGRAEAALARRLQLDCSVRFLGPVRDVAAVLHAADLFIMPSLHEGLGIAAVEALGVGIPAVLADVEGLRDLREVALECEWVTPEPVQIARAIERIASLSVRARLESGAHVSARIHARFAMARGASQYAALYAVAPGAAS